MRKEFDEKDAALSADAAPAGTVGADAGCDTGNGAAGADAGANLAGGGRPGAMPVAERFVSINGEGRSAGKLAAFIRFTGCNLRCSYCDTMWANEPGAAEAAEALCIDDLVAWVRENRACRVTLTGGEPAIQPLLPDLIAALLAEDGPDGCGLAVEVETNGAADLAPLVAVRERLSNTARGTLSLTVDWKLPASGMERHMIAGNFALLDGCDTVKFVCGGEGDLSRALEVARELDLPGRVAVYLSPVFDSIEPAAIVRFMQRNDMRWATMQLQLHKIIWPNVEKGV